MPQVRVVALLVLLAVPHPSAAQLPTPAIAQSTTSDASKEAAPAPKNTSPPAAKVDVTPLARDEEIQARLTKIFHVAGLFENPQVNVQDGVVFLSGRTAIEANKDWASDLARNTEDVVAVVNHIEVERGSLWDFGPAVDSLKQMQINLVRALPLIAFGAAILILAYATALLVTRWMRRGLSRRIYAPLLREVFARAAGFAVLVIGLYITLRIANLTHLALTILGGTGLLGLVLGIAFGNITENFLASILLSMQQPFRVGDLMQIGDTIGYVQRMTTRTTIVATVDGNEVQIPNATIYKSVIRNFTTIPNCRVDFDMSAPRTEVEIAQQCLMDVLTEHPAVLDDPEPTVLVENVSESYVTLRVYFWINGRENSRQKVRSSLMRLAVHALDQPVQHMESRARASRAATGKAATTHVKPTLTPAAAQAAATRAEGDLCAESTQIEEQVQETRTTNGPNLLAPEGTDAQPLVESAR